MRKKILIALFTLFILALAFPALYYFHYTKIKLAGITLVPSKAIPTPGITFYLQNDPQWSDIPLGSSAGTMGQAGCLITSIASDLHYYDEEFNPQTVIEIFNENSVLNQDGDVIWSQIQEAIPNVTYHYKRVFSNKTIENDLQNNRFPLVKVKYEKTGVFHWVLVIGSDENDFYVMDPLFGEKEPLKLSEHGKVYAYRVLIKE